MVNLKPVSVLVLTFFIVGCINDPLDYAESLIDEYNYTEAHEVLTGLSDSEVDPSRLHSLRARALFVEGYTSLGFEDLNASVENNYLNDYDCAETMLRAADVIIREKNRVREVVVLLDSSISRDPGVKNRAVDLAWKRAVEYLLMRGIDGYILMQFVIRHDPQMKSRLRAYNINLSKRYDDISEIDRRIHGWLDVLDDFYSSNERDPLSFNEFVTTMTPTRIDTVRDGWQFSMSTIEDTLRFIAKSRLKHPLGIQLGTVLQAP